jgi:hypothetical protein
MAKEHSRAKSALSGGHKKSGGKPHSIHVRRGHSGGFVATHHHKPGEDGSMQEPEEHVIPDIDSLNQHMASNMGDQPPAPAAPPPDPAAAQGAPPPAAGGAPAMQ